MALPLLVNGADCGPINPLQGLSKRFDQDRGIQQDQFGAGRAGSSREAFRTQYTPSPAGNQAASRFFSDATSHASPALTPGSTYDLSALNTTLPTLQSPTFALPPSHQTAVAPWAADFLQQQPQHVHPATSQPEMHAERQAAHTPALAGTQHPQPAMMHWTPAPLGLVSGYGPMHMASGFGTQDPMHQQQQHASQSTVMDWDKEFQSHEASLTAVTEVMDQQALQDAQPTSSIHVHDGDELARTAGLLVNTVQHEENPKFKNSEFLGLMRQLRDREMVVEGNQVVKNADVAAWAADFQATADVKGKGKGRAVGSVQPVVGTSAQPAGGSWASSTREAFRRLEEVSEDPVDAYFRQDNEEYIKYWQAQGSYPTLVDSVKGVVSTSQGANQMAEWDMLQRDWDSFEATSTGIKAVSPYQFQPNNPYLLGEASRTRHHTMHSQEMTSINESVLELEAAVQRDHMNSRAWYELGVKQQENEREQKAVQALRRALELDSTHLPSWVALAVSHTNEGNRQGTYHAIREWVERNDRYKAALQGIQIPNELGDGLTQAENFQHLAGVLMAMARSDTSGTIDPDIQIALAVLLNTSEEYDKARDCFLTALAVRPDDWLLYNRVGATLANSGHPEDALQYYYRALELNPAYIRARFNLGISCINLRRYEDAAQHILNALILQDSDGVVSSGGDSPDKGGITSSVLWESLKTCCTHMQRIDLATLCDRRELEAFRLNFMMA
ncbi:TPR-like protein [Cristinia sonorae]|uniref:TPR-like protein n=1 Tax=Cristinia sonorae TaxID=1940300 RepID=A0A8K0UL58_9AGAR|nr:TPR-like protein [Cristinia sonorae]